MLRAIIITLITCQLVACSTSTAAQPFPTLQTSTIQASLSPSITPSAPIIPPSTQTPEASTANITTIVSATFTFLPNDTSAIGNLAFVDDQHGWMMRGIFQVDNDRDLIGKDLLATSDGGVTWISLPAPAFKIEHLEFVSPTHGWATTPEGFRETIDGGRSWSLAGPERLPPSQIWLNQPGVTQPCDADYPELIRFLDQAHAWMMCRSEPTMGFQNKRLFTSQDGGRTWQLVADSAGTVPNTDLSHFGYADDLQIIDMQHAWMQVGRVGISFTADGGRTWANSESIPLDQPQVREIAPITPEHGFAIVDGDTLLETTDGAHTWTQSYPPLHPFGPIFFSDAQHGVGENTFIDGGATFRTTDGGSTWKRAVLNDNEQRELRRRRSRMDQPDSIWRTGAITWKIDERTETLMRSSNDGSSWQSAQLNQQVTSVSTSADKAIWVIAYMREGGSGVVTNSGLLRSVDNGASWTEYLLGKHFAQSQVCFIDDQRGWLTAQTQLYRTLDGGATWTQLY